MLISCNLPVPASSLRYSNDLQSLGNECNVSTGKCCEKELYCSKSLKVCMKTLSVLFIGNSFTYRNSLPSVFRNLVKSNPDYPNPYVKSVTYKAATLSFHVQRSITWKTIDSRAEWSDIVLQEQSQFLSFTDNFSLKYVLPSALMLTNATLAHNASTILFETWGYLCKFLIFFIFIFLLLRYFLLQYDEISD